MITDPRFAPKRTDLPFLQRRRLPKAAASAAPSPAAPAASAAPAAASRPPAASVPATPTATPTAAASAVHDFLAGGGTRRHPHEPAQPAAASPSADSGIDLSAPAESPAADSGLDLSAPAAPPSRSSAPPPAPAPSGLDLSAPTAPAAAAPPAAPPSSGLDLSAPTAPPAAAPPLSGASALDLGGIPAPPRPAAPPSRRRTRPVARVAAGRRHILTVAEPTITFSRLQSGIGTLTFEAACGEQVGDLRLGALYELADGYSSALQLTQGSRLAPPRSRRPVLVGGRDRFEHISVDLRQARGLRRLAVYAFSESRSALNWGGTLVAETFGGARVELPLEGLPPQDTAVLMSLYNVDGEFVVRAEMQAVVGGVRAGAAAFGYDRITWLDDRTPVE